MRARALPLAIALALFALPGAAVAQAGKSPPPKAKLDAAVFRLRVMISAMQSDKVDAKIKDVLFGCIYENSLSKLSDAMDKVIAANPGKVTATNPDQILGVMAGVCGYKPGATPPARNPAKPPAKNGR